MNSIIAENLRKLREAARYTQEEISQAIGITRSAYSNYESQLVPNGATTASLSDQPSIRSKMKSLRTKWEARGCPITKSPYE